MAEPLEDWKQGVSEFSASHLQQPVNAIRELQALVGAQGLPARAFGSVRLGKVTTAGPGGEGNYTDARYWVKRAYAVGGEINDALDVQDEPVDETDAEELIFTATNVAELVGDTHLLGEDAIVLCVPIWDGGDPQTKRWVFSRPAAILDMRWNATTHKIQVSYVESPGESDWVDKISFSPC